jgi:hypothetical protein
MLMWQGFGLWDLGIRNGDNKAPMLHYIASRFHYLKTRMNRFYITLGNEAVQIYSWLWWMQEIKCDQSFWTQLILLCFTLGHVWILRLCWVCLGFWWDKVEVASLLYWVVLFLKFNIGESWALWTASKFLFCIQWCNEYYQVWRWFCHEINLMGKLLYNRWRCERNDQKMSWRRRHLSSVDVAPRKRSWHFSTGFIRKKTLSIQAFCYVDFSFEKPMRYRELWVRCMMVYVLIKSYQNKCVILEQELTENNL